MILDLIFFADKSFSRKLLVTYVKNLRGRVRGRPRDRVARLTATAQSGRLRGQSTWDQKISKKINEKNKNSLPPKA